MLRWSVSFGVLIVLMATSSDVLAQRRQPLRNLSRQIGERWGTGLHWANPGHSHDYYSPYSEINTPTNRYHQGTMTPNSHPQNGQIIHSHDRIIPKRIQSNTDTSTQIYNQPGIWQTDSATRNQPYISDPSAINSNYQINKHLKPYHQNTKSEGNFWIRPESTWKPAETTPSHGWNTNYGRHFRQNSTGNQK